MTNEVFLVIVDLATTWMVVGAFIDRADAEAYAGERYGKHPYKAVRVERRAVRARREKGVG